MRYDITGKSAFTLSQENVKLARSGTEQIKLIYTQVFTADQQSKVPKSA